MSKTKKTETKTNVASILDAPISVAGKHVFSNQGVVQIPKDSVETLTVLNAINMYRSVEQQVKLLSQVLVDWEAIVANPEKYVD